MYLNLDKKIYSKFDTKGLFDIPVIKAYEGKIPANIEWQGFNYSRNIKNCSKEKGTHFFLDDYQFEIVFNKIDKYIIGLKKCGIVLAPDFSLYSNFPLAVQIYNHYRKHFVARYWQDNGIKVVPTICWSTQDSYNFCFDGEPTYSSVAISSTGTMNDKEAFNLFIKGYNEMCKRLSPTEILCFTSTKNVKSLKVLDGNIKFIDVCVFDKKKEGV